MTAPTRTRLRLELGGLIAVHAVRAAWTALGAVEGILSAEVTMAGATIEIDRRADVNTLLAALREALDAAGLTLLSTTVVRDRILPVA